MFHQQEEEARLRVDPPVDRIVSRADEIAAAAAAAAEEEGWKKRRAGQEKDLIVERQCRLVYSVRKQFTFTLFCWLNGLTNTSFGLLFCPDLPILGYSLYPFPFHLLCLSLSPSRFQPAAELS